MSQEAPIDPSNPDCKPATAADHAEQPQFRDLAPAIEFCCWVVVSLAPFLRWINGAAVTDDQFVIQVALVVTALTAAIGLRIYNWRMSQSQHE